MTKRIIRIDASALKQSQCFLRFWNIVIEGYKEPIVNNDIQYGTAVHKFISTMMETGNIQQAYKDAEAAYSIPMRWKPKKHFMDVKHLKQTCFYLWESFISTESQFEIVQYEKDDKLVPAIEVNFALPYYTDDIIEVLLCGTIDQIGKIKNGNFALRDFKTTSSWNQTEYLDGYELDPQLIFYKLCLQLFSKLYPSSTLGKIGATPLNGFIDGIFLKPDATKLECKRSKIFDIRQPLVDEMKMLIDYMIKKVSDHLAFSTTGYCIRDGILNGSCNTKFGPCMFTQVCASPDDIAKEFFLKKFIKREYNPLAFGKIE